MSFTKYQAFTFVIGSSDKLPAITTETCYCGCSWVICSKISYKLLKILWQHWQAMWTMLWFFMNLGRGRELSVVMHTQHVNALTFWPDIRIFEVIKLWILCGGDAAFFPGFGYTPVQTRISFQKDYKPSLLVRVLRFKEQNTWKCRKWGYQWMQICG
jgi:hypothetical protein